MTDLKAFQRYGDDIDSASSWEEMTDGYVGKLKDPYHRHRLEVIKALIPAELYQTGKKIFDFGCGDGVLFPDFIKAGAEIGGVDIADNMISLAKARLIELEVNPDAARLGGVKELSKEKSTFYDAIFSFNVLAYLTDAEEALFYQEAKRILRPGGYLIVTHSNELFDLFSQNAYTGEFLKQLVSETYKDQVSKLIVGDKQAVVTYNVRENPLAYKHKLTTHGFSEVRQEFINLHEAPPSLLKEQKSYPDTLSLPEAERWKLNFTCSTFGSLSRST